MNPKVFAVIFDLSKEVIHDKAKMLTKAYLRFFYILGREVIELTLAEKSAGYILLIVFAYILKRKGIFVKSDKNVLGKLLMYITLPCAFVGNFEAFQKSYSMIYIFIIGIVVNIFMIFAGFLFSAGRRGDIRAMYMIECSGYNIGAFTTPFISSFFPAEAIVIASIFDIGNCIMGIGGVFPLAHGVMKKKGHGIKHAVKEFIIKLFSSVPFDTYLFMLIISLFGIRLPSAINNITKMAGSSSIVITMIMIGITFELSISKRDLSDITKILLIRYLAGIIAGVIIWNFFDFTYITKKVLLLCLVAPVTSISPTFCNLCRCRDTVYGAVSSLTVPVSLAAFILIMHIF